MNENEKDKRDPNASTWPPEDLTVGEAELFDWGRRLLLMGPPKPKSRTQRLARGVTVVLTYAVVWIGLGVLIVTMARCAL